MASLKFVAAAVLIATVIVFSVAYGVMTYVWNPLSTTPVESKEIPKPYEGYIYSGSMAIQIPFYSWYNNSKSTASADLPDTYIYHADKSRLFGSDTGATGSISGELEAEDAGILYLVADCGTTTTVWPFQDEYKSPYIVAGSKTFWDHDSDGIDEPCWKMDWTALGPLAAGESTKTKYVNLYACMAETGPALTSLVNVTGVSTSTYADYTTEFYISSFAGEGYALVLAKVEFHVFNHTGAGAAEYGATAGTNETYPDTGKVSFVSCSIGYGKDKTKTFTSAPYDSSQYKWVVNIGVSDMTEPFQGFMVHYDKAAGTTFARIKLTLHCGSFAAGERFIVMPKIYYIDPAGTQASMNLGVGWVANTEVLSYSV